MLEIYFMSEIVESAARGGRGYSQKRLKIESWSDKGRSENESFFERVVH